MAISRHLKEILVCPKCKGELEFYEEKDEIHCRPCSLIYPIEEGIPVMLMDAARPMKAAP
jgi:uncharacterized protein YbaR (Trm112 family)